MPTWCLSDMFQGGIPQLSIGGGRVMERSARSEGMMLEDCGALLHGGEALMSLAMLVLRLVERRDEEGIRGRLVLGEVRLIIAPYIESDVIRAWHSKSKVLCGIDESDGT